MRVDRNRAKNNGKQGLSGGLGGRERSNDCQISQTRSNQKERIWTIQAHLVRQICGVRLARTNRYATPVISRIVSCSTGQSSASPFREIYLNFSLKKKILVPEILATLSKTHKRTPLKKNPRSSFPPNTPPQLLHISPLSPTRPFPHLITSVPPFPDTPTRLEPF